MRVLFMSSFPSVEAPGRCVFNLRAARGLRAFGDVHVVRFRYWHPGRPFVEKYVFDGFPVITISLPFAPPLSYSLGLFMPGWNALARRHLAALCQACDVIHSVDVSLNGIIAAGLAQYFKRPHLAQVIGCDILSELPRRIRYPWQRGWVDGVDLALCNSDSLRAAWQRRYSEGPEAVTRYRGTDLSYFKTDRAPNDHARRFLFLGGYHHPLSGVHGADLKGAVTLMKAWSQLDADPAFGGELVFGGPNSRSPEVRRWRDSLVRPDQVQLCGLLPPDDVRKAMCAADVVLLASRSEGLPNLAVESAAMRRVVFGSRVGGVPEIVRDRETGLLLPAGAVSAWADAIRQATAGRYPLSAWGNAARHHVERHFDQQSYGRAIVELYERILSAAPVASKSSQPR